MSDETTPEQTPGANPAESPEEVGKNPLAALEADLEKLRNDLLYAQAETQNVRRRLEKEKADSIAYAATGFARDMLSVADNLGRALAAIPAEIAADERIKPLVTGIEMTARELETVFQRNGVTRIAAVGEPLDPNRHQAIMEVESPDAAPGTVVHEMQSGYMIKDRLLRPAMVGVAKAPAGAPSPTPSVDLEA
ncbi:MULTISPECIES: nucleotide exchange factor GrpE [Sphingomonadales]|uniref:Protein GrpE n=2 Tax=Edaphosphingomonas TaxID=3423724 RepID=A0A2T4HPA7_9SPHN|nr:MULTISPECIES: nucleotide exchange factor GrpE [Sphingomonas]AGH49137.1 GrpE protein HSP-70 cofactor [Sphingomonas sp. MM-1]OHT21561.1 Protein GrpE [Sphingomonas haloaromaticamans]PTD17639.1 nucleotide exchange factor GrpE [Sphingomonas fennica]